jgi:hypothetical protein
LPNNFDFTASCRPLRCMMFLNCECPAMTVSLQNPFLFSTSLAMTV